MITEISSLQHPLVKEWVKLRTEKKTRIELNSVLLIGEKMVRELSRKIILKTLIATRPVPEIPAQNHYLISDEILRKITGLPAPDGFAAIAPLPQAQSLANSQRILILDRLSDPGNLGTLLRTALALNWDGVLFTPETVDPFNDKALRASKGALFSLPYNSQTPSEVTDFLHKERLHVYLADLVGTPLAKTTIKPPFALILSNEGSGPSFWANKCSEKISIPMHNGVDSLNVAVSGAIFLYAMVLQ